VQKVSVPHFVVRQWNQPQCQERSECQTLHTALAPFEENLMQEMLGRGPCFHRRSLTLASGALLLSVVAATQALGLGVQLSKAPSSAALFSVVCTVSWCVVAFTVCICATWNLIADVERGYPPSRGQLAAVLLLFAFSLSGWLMFSLIRAALESSLT
jgi:hypothetical protein